MVAVGTSSALLTWTLSGRLIALQANRRQAAVAVDAALTFRVKAPFVVLFGKK